MTIWHHSPNINSDVLPSHLLAKVGMCGSVRVPWHACYDQAWILFFVLFRPSQTIIQDLHHQESKSVNFRVYSLNVGTLRGIPRGIAKMFKCRMSLVAYKNLDL